MPISSEAIRPVSNADWRADLISRQGFFNKVADQKSVEAMLKHLCYAQLDSIRTVERAQHGILHARLKDYQPHMLDALVKDRLAFENWTHDACVLPIDLFPFIKLRFEREAKRMVTSGWWKGMSSDFDGFRDLIRSELRDKGALPLRHFTDLTGSKPKEPGMWQWSGVKLAIEYMWRMGEVAVCHRQNFNKIYNLTERIIPPETYGIEHGEDECISQLVLIAADRLGLGTVKEIADFWGFLKIKETAAKVEGLVGTDLLEKTQRTRKDGSLETCYRTTNLTLALCDPSSVGLKILSPFDPLVRNRDRLEKMFGFTYRFEAYVPKAKRQYGYYVFPVLENRDFVGRVDMSVVKSGSRQTLEVRLFWPEPGLRDTQKRRADLYREFKACQKMAGADELHVAPDFWQ